MWDFLTCFVLIKITLEKDEKQRLASLKSMEIKVSEVLISKGLVLTSGGAELALYLSGLGPEESKQSFLPRAVSL